jgi:anti-sigma regulatory factor (Ser/Thr protein kinase)
VTLRPSQGSTPAFFSASASAEPAEGRLRMAALTVAADKDYLALVRTCAMQVAALLDLPLPRVADLRLAVDEACTSFLVPAPGREFETVEVPGATLRLCFDRYPDHLRVTVRGAAPPLWPAHDELGWEMLRAILGDVHAEVVDGIGTLTLIEPLPGLG